MVSVLPQIVLFVPVSAILVALLPAPLGLPLDWPEGSIILNCRRTRDQVVMRPRAARVLAKSSLNP